MNILYSLHDTFNVSMNIYGELTLCQTLSTETQSLPTCSFHTVREDNKQQIRRLRHKVTVDSDW